MDNKILNVRKKIFNEELSDLKRGNYINEDEYTNLSIVYEEYYKNKNEKIILFNNNKEIEILNNKEGLHKGIEINKETILKPIYKQEIIERTAEQTRERNITWSLIMGVIMLLIGGLVVSTSNWNVMGDVIKVFSITAVSILFLGLSWFSEKVLKINKTAFAFLTLGSLFVPIIFLAAGYLELFGKWLSIQGDGKFILGLLGSGISLSLYVFNAKKYNSKIFIWLSLLTSTIVIGFLLASLKLSVDIFYFGIMFYNAFILFIYYKYKNNEKINWFSKEIPHYAQLNLIVSTLLMLSFFNNYVLYSFNVILTAILYISMTFVYKSKQYHFVFTALLVYGIYQLTLNTPLENIKEVLFASIAIVYIGLQSYLKDEQYLQKAFQWTGAIISFCSFIYISVQGLILESEHTGIVMFLAIVIVAINYIYLSNVTTKKLFEYLATLFSIVAGYELFKSFEIWSNYAEVFMFLYTSTIFYIYYFNNKFKFLQKLKESALLITSGTFSITVISALFNEKWLTVSLLLFLYAIIAYLISMKTNIIFIKKISEWVSPLSLLFSMLCLYSFIENKTYIHSFGIPFHYALSGVILLFISYFYKKINNLSISKYTFFISQSVYLLALLNIPLSLGINWTYIVPLLFIGGIIMFTLLVRYTKLKIFWNLVATSTTFLYLSLMKPFGIIGLDDSTPYQSVSYILLLPVLMIGISRWLKYKNKESSVYFYWNGQLSSLFTSLLSLLIVLFDNLNPILLFIPLLMYISCSIDSKNEIVKKIQLYISLLYIPVIIYFNSRYYDMSDKYIIHFLLLSVAVIIIIWSCVNVTWKNRIEYFLIPFSFVSVIPSITEFTDKLHVINLFVMILIIFNLYLIHKRKWDIINIIPLLQFVGLSLVAIEKYNLNRYSYSLIFVILVFILKYIGEKKYEKLTFNRYFDWYTFITFFYYIIFECYVIDYSIVLRLLPSILLTYMIYSQIKRVNRILTKNILKTLLLISLLIPYYKIIDEIINSVSPYLRTELYVLPFILLTISLKLKIWSNKNVMVKVEWLLLLIISAILMTDALTSSTIYDAIIIGVLSLASILSGMSFKVKSYFFIGSGMLLLTIYTQTKPMWGNMPWWIYLLIGGITLIGFASFHEFQKQNKKNFLQNQKEKLKQKFKEWK